MTIPHLKCENELLGHQIAEDEARALVGEGEEGGHLVARALEHGLPNRPAQDDDSQKELQPHSPGHVAPPHLRGERLT